MYRSTMLAALAMATPLAAMAQVSYGDGPLTREELRVCMERDHAVRARQSSLADERMDNDRESAAIAREGARLAEDLRNLDNRDTLAVADYNARSDAHNRRVESHNRRVAELNARTALVNGDAADVTASCGARTYWMRDRDAVLRDRGSIR